MSDTPSIYKSVLGLNETGGTLFLVPYVQYKREAFADPNNQQIRPDGYHCSPFKLATPIMGISSNPSIRCEDRRLTPPSISSTFRRIGYSEWVKPGLSE